MSKIYEVLYNTDYLTKNYHFVDYIQNTPRNEKDEEHLQSILAIKHHSDLENIIGGNAFINGSGNELTINTVDSKYEIDGKFVIEGFVFDFDEEEILTESETAISYPLTVDGHIYLKITIEDVTYLDDSTIGISDPITPSYIQSTSRKALTAIPIYSTNASIPDTPDTLYRKIGTFTNATTSLSSSIGTFYPSASFYNDYSQYLDDLFVDGTIDGDIVLIKTDDNFTEYPTVLNLSVVNSDTPAGGSFGTPAGFATGYDAAKLVWDDMRNFSVWLTQAVTSASTTVYINDYIELFAAGPSNATILGSISDPFQYTAKDANLNRFTGVTAIDTSHPANTPVQVLMHCADDVSRHYTKKQWLSIQSYLVFMLSAEYTGTVSDVPLASCIPNSDTYDNGTTEIPVNSTEGFNVAGGTAYWIDDGSSFSYTILSAELTADFDGVSGTINVDDTTGFPATGSIRFVDGNAYTYSGLTATTFTGVSTGVAQLTGADAYSDSQLQVSGITGSHVTSSGVREITLDPMGLWYFVGETQNNYYETEIPKGSKVAFYVCSKISDIKSTILKNIPTLSFAQY